ncbi:hypothetical protein ACN28S_66795 [Cystobacter fuscus]
MVFVVGEPGVGKSRLLNDFAESRGTGCAGMPARGSRGALRQRGALVP